MRIEIPGSNHPAQRMYLLTMFLLLCTVILGFSAVFVPWAMKDIAPGMRAWAYPFKTCIQDTFSPYNAESCQDNDFIKEGATPLTGGNKTCKAFILSTIAFVFISVLGGVVLLIFLAFILDRLFSRPTVLAAIAQVGLIFIFIACCLAWIMFICYAEMTCAPNSIFPVHGYSYGFILYIFASVCSLGAITTGFFAISKLKKFQPLPEVGKDEVGVSDDVETPAPMYPVYEPQQPSTSPSQVLQPSSNPSFNAAGGVFY